MSLPDRPPALSSRRIARWHPAAPSFTVREIAAIIALFFATLIWRFLTFTGFTNDHYAHFALAQQLLLGDRPIRDFSDPGWPLTYLLSAAAWRTAGDAMVVEWALTALAFAAGAAMTVAIAYRLGGSLGIAVLVALVEVGIYPRTYSYPKILAYTAAAGAMMAVAARPSIRRIVIMSAVVAIAFLLRHDHGIYIGLSAVVCVAWASRADRWRTAVRRSAFLTAATAAFLLPWVLFVTVNGGLFAYFERALEYARAEANASNLRSWPRLTLVPGKPLVGLDRPNRPLAQVEWTADLTGSARSDLEQRYGIEFVREADEARVYYVHDTSQTNLEALAHDPRVEGTTGLGRVRRPFWRETLAAISPLRVAPALHSAANGDAWLFWLFWSLPILCGAIAWRRAIDASQRWQGELAVVGGLCVMAVLVNTGFLRDILRTRFADAVVPAALLAAWALGLCWTGRWRRRGLQIAMRAASVVVATVSIVAVSHIAEFPERSRLAGIDEGLSAMQVRAHAVSTLLRLPHRQDVAPPSRFSAALLPFFAYLDRCTFPSDRLIVTGEFPDILVLAGRRFAGDGVVLGAWYSSVRLQHQTVAQLRTRPALFVLLIDTAAFRLRYPLIDEYVAGEYRPMTEVAVQGAGTVPILVSRNRAPVRVDPDTGWPCFTSPG